MNGFVVEAGEGPAAKKFIDEMFEMPERAQLLLEHGPNLLSKYPKTPLPQSGGRR